jgi:hypothetical protein
MTHTTLLWNSKDYSREHILIHCNETSKNANRIIDSIFRTKRTERLIVTKNRYFYNPSDEYKEYVRKWKRKN